MKLTKIGFIAKVGGEISAHDKIRNLGCLFISEEKLKTDNNYIPTIYESERGARSAIRYRCQYFDRFDNELFATGEVIPVKVTIEIEELREKDSGLKIKTLAEYKQIEETLKMEVK